MAIRNKSASDLRKLVGGSRLFDKSFYRRKAKFSIFQNSLSHFLKYGDKSKISPSKYFDVNYYLLMHQDIRLARINPLVHYLLHGWKENRKPNPYFDSISYIKAHQGHDFLTRMPVDYCIEQYGDAKWPLDGQGYSDTGASYLSVPYAPIDGKERLILQGLFDPAYYVSQNEDLDFAGMDPFWHFETEGWKENRNPRAGFDMAFFNHAWKPDQAGITQSPLSQLAKTLAKGKLVSSDGKLVVLDQANMPETAADISLRYAIHVHLYYPEIILEILEHVQDFKCDLTLIVTTCQVADQIFIEQKLSVAKTSHMHKLDFEVRVVSNRGRDVAPFLIACRDLWSRFDVLLHLHSKRSLHISWGEDWRNYLFDNLIGNEKVFLAALNFLSENDKIGFLYPENFFRIKNNAAENTNHRLLEAFMNGSEQIQPKFANNHFAAGSMGWFRTSAFAELLAKVDNIDLFEAEEKQIDQTLAHVLERAFPRFAVRAGYEFRAFATTPRPKAKYRLPKISRDPDCNRSGERWQRDGVSIAKNEMLTAQPLTDRFNPACLNINWIIPDFVRGAGGHMTIFRMVALLEKFGHRQTIWIQNPGIHAGPEGTKRAICDWYQPVGAGVNVRSLPDDVRAMSGDIVIATDCWTAYPASLVTNVKERFYFIQDDEADFHPAGELRLVAEQTYHMGFAALCAGPWLQQRMSERGMWARAWPLCSDPEYYFPVNRPRMEGPLKIAFYARHSTPRRAVNLGIAGLQMLAQRRNDVEIHLFGDNVTGEIGNLKFVHHGILSPQQLGTLYRSCDIGLVFSATNYSLIPLEMMACRLAVVELDTGSTRAVFKDGEVAFAPPTPAGIANTIAQLADDPEARARLKSQGEIFLRNLNWEASARLVEAAIIERLLEKAMRPINPISVCAPAIHQPVKASVIIPTLNAGPLLRKVLEQIVSQNCPFPYDALIIDSGSTDGTVETVKSFANRNIRLHEIPKSEFQHGRTRNLAISMTDGDYVAVLTQDALPCNAHWLSALIGGFSRSNRVAGVIGRHFAFPDHGAFAARDLDGMFDRMRDFGDRSSLELGLPSFVQAGSSNWQMLLQFYSDNNSAMSRRVWQECPYPEIDWGEDQVWAWEVLKLGFEKIYVDEARVFHSHAFTPRQQYEVAATEGAFWGNFYGLELVGDVEASNAASDAADSAFATANKIPFKRLQDQKALNRASAQGRYDGYRASMSANQKTLR